MTVLKAAVTAAVFVAALFPAAVSGPAAAQTFEADWAKAKTPPAPTLADVKIDPKTSAFLVLDLIKQTCSESKRPRCIASLPKVKAFLDQARAHQMPVVYSLAGAATTADIAKSLAPLGSEPIVRAHADKFIGTDLDQILKKLNAKTLVIVGTTAEGAVLFTASHAAFLNYKVVVPVEGSTSSDLYAEQATDWMLANAPTVGQQTTLTSFDKIGW
jgi:nicotinamidase-related amidase